MSERQQDQANTKDAVEAQVSDADLQASILFTKTDGPQKAVSLVTFVLPAFVELRATNFVADYHSLGT